MFDCDPFRHSGHPFSPPPEVSDCALVYTDHHRGDGDNDDQEGFRADKKSKKVAIKMADMLFR